MAITDNVTCTHCLEHEGEVYRTGRGEGYMTLIDKFPDLVWESDVVVRPNVHMSLWGKDTCRCRIFLASLATLEDNQPVNPVMNEKPQTDNVLPAPKQPAALTYNPVKIEPEQTTLTDNQYMNFLDGLLALGYISTAVYGAIIGRREKQKVTKDEVLTYLKTLDEKSSVWVEIQKLIQK